MTRRDFLASVVAASLVAKGARPNIVLILADDLGYGDLGCFGQKMIATPHIDRFAAEGTRFTQTYAGASVCAPSRCCLMTGLHTGHAHIRGNFGPNGERVSLRPKDVTVARVLKAAGYRTACIGKWGLGEAGTAGVPNSQGFDEWFGFLNQDHALEYFPTHLWDNSREIFPAGNQGAKRNDYVQDLFTRRAVDFIGKMDSSPFFLYLAFTLPHANSELGRDTGNGFPVPNFGPYGDRPWPAPEKGFAATMSHLDDSVGRVVETLRARNLERNTLVIFTSDNGPAVDAGHTPDFFGSRGQLRGAKGSLFEGGIRVPAIARWPGTVPAGVVSRAPWAFWDFLPTAAELAGSSGCPATDGRSIVPLLSAGIDPSERFFYWEQTNNGVLQQAARIGKWKALRQGKPGSRVSLFDLSADPGELVDRAQGHPEVVGQVEVLLQKAHVEPTDQPAGKKQPAGLPRGRPAHLALQETNAPADCLLVDVDDAKAPPGPQKDSRI